MDFFDTNILVYTVDPTEPRRREVARQVVREALGAGGFAFSAQVMQEFYNVVTRRQLLSHEDAVALLREWSHERVVSTTPELVWAALALREQWQFSIWDALVVQAAIDAGCARLVTEDLHHGQRIGDVEIFNPFRSAAAVHEPAAPYRATVRKSARK